MPNEITIKIHDNSGEILDLFDDTCFKALERCGMTGEGYAKDLAKVDTGMLRNSISHEVDDSRTSVYIGTNAEHGPYVELGTGKYVDGGRPTPWAYQDVYGNWHWTAGNPAAPFLKPAVADHVQTYKNIIDDEFKNG